MIKSTFPCAAGALLVRAAAAADFLVWHTFRRAGDSPENFTHLFSLPSFLSFSFLHRKLIRSNPDGFGNHFSSTFAKHFFARKNLVGWGKFHENARTHTRSKTDFFTEKPNF
uniref:(northern house mosquito) hypothetical protein n=1 Tax=Culex pipiens TaxID=7175 RepID=A0A8D8A2K0_CULPI